MTTLAQAAHWTLNRSRGIAGVLAVVAAAAAALGAAADSTALLVAAGVLLAVGVAVLVAAWPPVRRLLWRALRLRRRRPLACTQAAGGPVKTANLDRRHVVELCASGDVLDAWALAEGQNVLPRLSRGELLVLVRELRKRGYLRRAESAADVLVSRFGDRRDETLRARVRGEIAVLGDAVRVEIDSPGPAFAPVAGRVLHVVGASLPDQQSGYTLRTHYTAQAQLAAGQEVHVVTQAGFGEPEGFTDIEIDGIVYHRCPGSPRGKNALDAWFRQNVQRVEAVVRKVKPAVLHAASDLLNARTALLVGRAYGIPVVYESRGFWEETWLQRQADTFGWSDLDALARDYGLPDVYVLRRETEDRCRREADAVVTLAGVMADRIVAAGVDRDAVTVIPNGVDAERFPVTGRDPGLAAEHGIEPGDLTIGYISSLVDYEGVDVLIRAVAALRDRAPDVRTRLLVVGDGPERESLVDLARSCGLDDAAFPGRVPHDDVLRYYGLIDVFVVPRRPVDVCQLVTPLKPFEALACGRTLVVSDVGALREIAADSQAAALFTAGDHDSLADVLLRLARDPAERAQLAARGVSWVREERTWAGNALAYLRLYEGIGGLPTGTFDIALATTTKPTVEEYAAWLAARGPLGFGPNVDPEKREGADAIIGSGWVTDGHRPVVFAGELDWDTLCADDRSWAFRLHAWDFMGPVLRAHELTGDRRYLSWCRDIAVSWARRFTSGGAGGTMAWYDMSLGLRAPRLAYLIEQLILAGDDLDGVEILRAAVVRHQSELLAERAFTPTTNHGFYTAIGQLMLAVRLRGWPGMEAVEGQARSRLAVVVRTQFAPDGGHLEHSPDYHRMLTKSFSAALSAGLIEDTEVERRVRAAEEALDWMVQPNRRLVQIGDSPDRMMGSKPPVAVRRRWGKIPRPEGAPETLLVLKESGYAFVRHPGAADDGSQDSYLSLMAAFHSRTHKHADDLSFTWFDRGHEITIDSGRFGYLGVLPKNSPDRQKGFFYGAPERQFVESTRAHNTVEVNGQDHERRTRNPYGSGIVGAEERDGHYRVEGFVDHGPWKHRRVLTLRPGQWLLVEDSIEGPSRPAQVRSWLNLPEELDLAESGDGVLRAAADDWPEPLWIGDFGEAALIPPVQGQRDPLRGWRSRVDREVTPAWSVGFLATDVRSHTFRTLLAFGATAPDGLPQSPFGAAASA